MAKFIAAQLFGFDWNTQADDAKSQRIEFDWKSSVFMNGHGGRRPGAGRKVGSQNRTTQECRALFQSFGPAAARRAAEMAGLIIEDGNPVGIAKSEQVQAACLAMVLDRAYGRATQVMQQSADEGLEAMLERIGRRSAAAG